MGSSKSKVIGIDLGTCYSRVAVVRNGKVEMIPNDQGFQYIRSFVAFTDSENLIGDEAFFQRTLNPTNTVFCVKRLIGRKFNDPSVQNDMKHWPFKVIDVNDKPMIQIEINEERKLFSPEEISSMILTKMASIASAYLGEKVNDVVITVPANFNDSQRQATKDAGKMAGLNVVKLMNEPTAAALAYSFDKGLKGERNVLIFDLGGGSLDVSILTINDGSLFKVRSTAGATHLGGEDFDNRILNYSKDEFRSNYDEDIGGNQNAIIRLRSASEWAKVSLSMEEEHWIEVEYLLATADFDAKISRSKFEELNSDIFTGIMECLNRALNGSKLDKSQIHDVVLVGGCSRIPKIKKLIQEHFGVNKPNIHLFNSEKVVASGAAIQGAIISGDTSKLIKDVRIDDV